MPRVNIDFGSQIPTTHLDNNDGEVHEVAPEDTGRENCGACYAQVIVGIPPDAGDAQEVTTWCRIIMKL